jgi:Skp family chaperone for outer membrane proteins
VPTDPGVPAVDPQEILKAISGINLDAIDADIESAFGAKMAELDKMLEGLDDLVNKIEADIQHLDQPKPDGPQ